MTKDSHPTFMKTEHILWMHVVFFIVSLILFAICLYACLFVRWVYKRRLIQKSEGMIDRYQKEEQIKRDIEIARRKKELLPPTVKKSVRDMFQEAPSSRRAIEFIKNQEACIPPPVYKQVDENAAIQQSVANYPPPPPSIPMPAPPPIHPDQQTTSMQTSMSATPKDAEKRDSPKISNHHHQHHQKRSPKMVTKMTQTESDSPSMDSTPIGESTTTGNRNSGETISMDDEDEVISVYSQGTASDKSLTVPLKASNSNPPLLPEPSKKHGSSPKMHTVSLPSQLGSDKLLVAKPEYYFPYYVEKEVTHSKIHTSKNDSNSFEDPIIAKYGGKHQRSRKLYRK
ncbi:unnamed protein product [Caenorhabditis bovis]|uniref:Uncharacterized protein n=1 Tax=Caenorhabditis bovis TaxID=2654633 RepID=A0A8S1F3Q2_9PELO|nr:unnamed protein product [Caenorhabditis bovis]